MFFLNFTGVPNGGKLSFDRDKDDLILNSEYVLLLDGTLELGTEEDPYLNKGNIQILRNQDFDLF